MDTVLSTKKTFIDPKDLPAVQAATLRRILGYLAPYQREASIVVSVIILQALLGIVPPLLVKVLIDRAIPTRNHQELVLLCVGMVVFPVLSSLLGVAKKYLSELIGEQLMMDLRLALFSHLHKQSLEYFTRARPGEAISHVLNDVQGVGASTSGTLVTAVDSLLVLCSTALLVCWLDWRLALLSLGLLPVFVLPTRRVGQKRKAVKREAQAQLSALTGLLSETLSVSGALLLKVFGTEAYALQRLKERSATLRDLALQQTLIGRWFNVLLGLFEAAGPALVYGVGGILVLRGEAQLGTVIAFVALLKRLYTPAAQLAGLRVDVMTSYAYFDRIFSVLDRTPSLVDAPAAKTLQSVDGRIEFRSVTFAYEKEQTALRSVSFSVNPGSTLAIVGPSGSGKSTVAALVARLYDPTEGSVLLDGNDLRSLTQHSLRQQMGIVTQEAFLFHASIAENLRFAKPDATLDELEQAARAAQIHDFLTQLPDGYNTLVGDRGYRLSGGERQRIAIARVLLKNPKILLLDEATSALDSVNEAGLQHALDRLQEGRTTILIAHRLSTVRNADEILVLDAGAIVERGTHDALLAQQGLYAKLYREQGSSKA